MVPGRQGSRAQDNLVKSLGHLVKPTVEGMPNAKESHLPIVQKKYVYDVFVSDHHQLYGMCSTLPVISCFIAMRKKKCSHIKFWSTTSCSICLTCHHLRTVLAECARFHSNPSAFIRQHLSCLPIIVRERKACQLKQEESMQDPLRPCSIIIDGADQSAFGLLHFSTLTKNVRGHSLKSSSN